MLNLMLLAADTPAGAPTSPFEVNFGLFVWTWLVFIALFLLLRKYAWPALLKATEDRERAIQAQLDDAERLNAEARANAAQQERTLAEARSSVHQLLSEAKSTAEKERALAMEKTRHEQEEMLARARREIAAEKERAIVELRREAVDLSLAAASKLIGDRLESDADRKLVMDYIGTMGEGH